MSGSSRTAAARSPWLLLLIPASVYLASYAYLGLYHGRAWLWSTVVHESGRYTLLETTFYASHFLGHVPVLVTLAVTAAGSWLWLSPVPPVRSRRLTTAVAAGLLLLLVGSAAVAVGHFGGEDTAAFVLQQRQRPDLDVEGGSWNLHLPSTLIQLALIPVAVWLARRLWARPVACSRRGLGLLALAAISVVAITAVANSDPVAALTELWRDPRYLAHAVRELATFSLTYYPIPLAVLLAREALTSGRSGLRRCPDLAIAAAAVACAVGVGWMVAVSLSHDIGTLAQRPEFAHGGRLSISYLLASHAFEHVLDSVFFTLLTLLLVWLPRRGSQWGGEAVGQ